MMGGTMLLVLLAAMSAGPAGEGQAEGAMATEGRRIEDGVLDSITLHADSIPRDAAVVIRPFSAAEADLGTGGADGTEERQREARSIQDDAPRLLAESFAAALRKLGPFVTVSVAGDPHDIPQGALVVEGEFTTLDSGAGKSTVQIEGTLRDGEGGVLAEFTQERHAGKLRSDCKAIGSDLARFLSAWAQGKKLD
jgi:hypothetical protein